MPPRKQPSGCQKRKKRKRDEELRKSQAGAILKYLQKQPQGSNVDEERAHCNVDANVNANVEEVIGANVVEDDVDVNVDANANVNANVEEAIGANVVEDDVDVNVDANANVNANVEEAIGANVVEDDDVNVNIDANVKEHDVGANVDANVEEDDVEVNQKQIDIFDPRTWGRLNPNMINVLVEKGPKRDLTIDKGPKNKHGRRFSATLYTRTLANKETCDRTWLVYSKELDKVFCFCCKLFKKGLSKGQLDNEGYGDWKHVNSRLKEHETGLEHMKNMVTWYQMRQRLKVNKTIDKATDEQLKK